MRKRVGLARALILEPEILLYDEPTTGLDPVATKNVDDMIRDISKQTGVTSVVISHDMASTFRIADRISMLYEGKIAVSGTPDEIQALRAAVRARVRRDVGHGPLRRAQRRRQRRRRYCDPPGERMKPTSAAIKVGITALAIALLGFLAFRFVAKGMHGSQGYRVWCIFHDATGLVDKSRVQIAGLNIGQIIDRRLEGSFARITIRVLPETQLWSNATVFKKSASLLGEFYLEIDPGTAESPDPMTGKMQKNHLLQDGDQIPNVVEAVSTSDILVQVNETLPVLRAILQDVRKLTQGPLQDIAKSVQNGVDKNSAAAESLLKHVDSIALDIKGMTAGRAGDDVEEVAREHSRDHREHQGPRRQGGTEMGSTGDKLRQDLDKIGSAVDNLNHTLENMSAMTDKVNRGEGTVGRLLNDDTIAQNVEQITEDAGGFIRSITRLQTIIGLRSEYNIIANYAQDLRLGAAAVAARQVLPHRARRRSARPAHRYDDVHDHRRSVQAADDGDQHDYHHRSLPLHAFSWPSASSS